MEIQYKDETIKLSEASGEWRWEGYSNVDLNKVREYINRSLRKDFQRFEALLVRYGRIERLVTVTSNPAQNVFWITGRDGREQIRVSQSLLLCKPDSAVEIEYGLLKQEIKTLNEKIRELEKHMENVVKKLEPIELGEAAAPNEPRR